jgi:hypothetical protein
VAKVAVGAGARPTSMPITVLSVVDADQLPPIDPLVHPTRAFVSMPAAELALSSLISVLLLSGVTLPAAGWFTPT